MTDYQPVKLAAMEGVWQSQSCAPMFFAGWVNEQAQTTTGIKIPVPCLLSILAYLNPQAVVTGLTSFPSDTWAPVNLVFQVYHIMIDLGFIFPLIGVIGLFFWWWGRQVYIVRPLAVGICVHHRADRGGDDRGLVDGGNRAASRGSCGTCCARPTPSRPRCARSKSSFRLLMFLVLYAVLFSLFIFLLNQKIQEGPRDLEHEEIPASLPDTFREVFRHSRASGE